MRSIKKLLALVMVAVMLVCVMAFSANAAEDVDYTDAAKKLASIDIMKGDTSGNLMLDNGVTRYQAALFFVQALTGETTVEKWNAEKQSEVFSDVPEYGTAIDYAYGTGLILGRGNGVYGYNDPITYQDMLVLAVRALGYETEGMSYPYGYIIAAQKLGLTENLATDIGNTQALTRGETAQIIWDMLNTELAVVDPVTDKILYPGEDSMSDALLGAALDRTTLLEKAGYSQTVIEATVVEYEPAETSKDIATVTLDNGMEIAAADLGITPRTNASEFLGLPVKLYVDSKNEDEFEEKYDIVAEDSEANIIFADFLTFTAVKNIGDEGTIKVTESTNGEVRITLGEKTFGENKYEFDVRVLTTDGWEEEDFSVVSDAFFFENKEYAGSNTYGEISYAVVENDEGAETEYKVIMLYKPYEFGQYFTRTMRYQPLVSDESFITIGKYTPGAVEISASGSVSGNENVDDDYTFFVETVLGSDLVFDQSITSISKRDGEASREAKISGGSVRSGDFIFYYYNELDNVLVIGQNCGGLKSGKLTSQNNSAETVKIDGTTYAYGFAGAFENEFETYAELDISNNYIAKLESGEDNVEYVAVNGRAIYIQRPLNPSNHRVKHNYVIATTNPEVMAELLNMDVDDYERKLTDDGIYVTEKGNMQIAVLNTSNGKWGLAEVAQYEYGTYNSSRRLYNGGYVHKDAEWPNVVNMAEHIENYGIFGENYKDYDKYEIARDSLLSGGLFAVRKSTNGVYNLSVMFPASDYGMINNGIVTDGIYFSDVAPKTNDVKSVRNKSTDPARITLNANTVVVVIDRDNNVGVRVGIQGEENSIIFSGATEDEAGVGGFLYSGTSKLIVLQISNYKTAANSVTVTDGNGNPFDVAAWADGAAAGTDETYYVGLNGADVEYERLDDGSYELTVSGLYNLRTMRTVAAIKLNVDDLDDTDIEDVDLTGKVIMMNKRGELELTDMDLGEALTEAVNMRSDKDEEFYEITSIPEFVDDSSISITIGDTVLDKKNAVAKINISVATLDATDLDWDQYDIDSIAFAEEYDDENPWGVGSIQYSKSKNDKYYAYELTDINATKNITEPTVGILDQYIIDTAGETLLVADTEADYFEDAAEVSVQLYACGQFDEDTGIVTIYVLKVLVPAE